MTIKYYAYNMFWGYFMAASILYLSHGDNEPRVIALQILSSVSALLFPYSKFLMENIALKYTNKEFWETGFFKDGVPKTYLITLYVIFTFITAIPLGVISILIEIKNAITRK